MYWRLSFLLEPTCYMNFIFLRMSEQNGRCTLVRQKSGRLWWMLGLGWCNLLMKNCMSNAWNALQTYVSQPTLRREGDARAHGCVFQERKMHGVATNFYSRKTSKKPESCGLRNLIVKGSGVVFTRRKGISTPCVRHKGR